MGSVAIVNFLQQVIKLPADCVQRDVMYVVSQSADPNRFGGTAGSKTEIQNY